MYPLDCKSELGNNVLHAIACLLHSLEPTKRVHPE